MEAEDVAPKDIDQLRTGSDTTFLDHFAAGPPFLAAITVHANRHPGPGPGKQSVQS